MRELYVCNVSSRHGGGDLPEPLVAPPTAEGPPVAASNAADWPDPPPRYSGAGNAPEPSTGGAIPEPLALPSME